MVFKLMDLPYDYDALEPHIDARTMQIHHGKHHQGYTNKLNAALEKYSDLQNKPARELLENLDALPSEIRTAVRNNGGGFKNHNIFWKVMSPNGGGEPTGKLAEAINQSFGSFEFFKDTFTKAAATQFGSGWGWLCKKSDGSLVIISTPNQDNPYSQGLTPLLGVDVWEHAYYLNYQNRRADYLKAWWNVVNWDEVTKRLEK